MKVNKQPRMSLFKYFKYEKLTDDICNNKCQRCPVEMECEYFYTHRPPLIVDIWFKIKYLPYDISHYVANYFAKRKKTHYRCAVCGRIEAPYFYDEEELRKSITHEYGWWKARSAHNTLWHVCHHCMEHGYVTSADNDIMGYTWDEWQDFVAKNNQEVMDKIKAKDPEYYERWFGDEEEV